MDRTSVCPADLPAQRARLEGFSAPEIYGMFPHSFPPEGFQDKHTSVDAYVKHQGGDQA